MRGMDPAAMMLLTGHLSRALVLVLVACDLTYARLWYLLWSWVGRRSLQLYSFQLY